MKKIYSGSYYKNSAQGREDMKKILEYKSSPFTSPSWGANPMGNEFRSPAQQLKAYEILEWVSICTDTLSRDAGGRSYYFTDVEGNRLKMSQVSEDILLPIEMGFFNENFNQMMKRVLAHRAITGNAFFLKSMGTAYGKLKNKIDMFTPIFPNEIKPITTLSGKYLISYELNFGNGEMFRVPADRIIHFKQNANLSLFWGMGNVTKMRLSAQGEAASLEYVNKFVKRQARPSMVITANDSQSDVDDYERRIDLVRDKFEGEENAGKMMYLEGDNIKAQALSVSQKDMQFLERQEYNRQTVVSMFGQNTFVNGIATGVNRATATVFTNQHYKNINSVLGEMEDALNKQHVHKIDKRIFMVFEKFPTGDIVDITLGVKNSIYTPSRGGELLGEPKDESPEAQKKYRIRSLIPLDQEELRPMPAMEEDKLIGHKNLDYDVSKEKLTDPKNIDAICEYFEQKLMHKNQYKARKFQVEYLRSGLRSRNATEDKYTDTIYKFFKRQNKRVIRAFDETFDDEFSKSIKDIKALITDNPENAVTLIFDTDFENKEYMTATKGLQTSAVHKSIADVNKITKSHINVDVSNVSVKETIERISKRANGFMTAQGTLSSVNMTTKKQISNIIIKSVNDNLSVAEMSDKIAEKLDGQAMMRARRIARTESRLAWDAGANVAYKELGVKEVDVVGCEGLSTMVGGTETYGYCGVQNIPIVQMSELDFHPNHIGVIVPSEEI